MRVLLVFLLAAAALAADEAHNKKVVTFYEDVLPILQTRCQGCHRPGEVAPMSFLTYDETRPWAQAIREAVLLRKMPPWFAEPGVGHEFKNDRSLSAKEVETLAGWAAAGSQEGDAANAPPPVEFAEGWTIGEPELVVRPPKPYAVPSEGVVEYTYVIVPSGFAEDRWLSKMELRPSLGKLVHHLIVWVRPPGSSYLEEYPIGEFFVPTKDERGRRREGEPVGDWREFLTAYAPGAIAGQYDEGQAKLVRAGSDFVFELHYTANGTAGEDRPFLGLTFADSAPEKRILTSWASNGKFVIPPGAPNHRVDVAFVFDKPATLLSLFPHMHLRGKSFEYRLVHPDGRSEVLLRVPKYDFNWQLTYDLAEPLSLPQGARIECTAYFDNSPNNPYNPEPAAEVRWGDQSWEEMMIGFMELAVDPDQEPGSVGKSEIPKDESQATASGGE